MRESECSEKKIHIVKNYRIVICIAQKGWGGFEESRVGRDSPAAGRRPPGKPRIHLYNIAVISKSLFRKCCEMDSHVKVEDKSHDVLLYAKTQLTAYEG